MVGGACHAIDLLRWIAGNPTETTAYSTKKVIMDLPTDDTVEAIFKFPGNVIGRVLASSGTKRPYTMRTEIFGTKGTILVDNTDGLITVFGDDLGEIWNKGSGNGGEKRDTIPLSSGRVGGK